MIYANSPPHKIGKIINILHLDIDIHTLPLIHRRLETTAIDDRFGQRKPVQNDMHITLIGSRMDLIRHVIGVIPLALVRQNRIDGQLMCVLSRSTMSESEQAPGNERLVGRYGGVKRYRDALLADRIVAYTRQQASRQARQRAADTLYVFQILRIANFDRISANR